MIFPLTQTRILSIIAVSLTILGAKLVLIDCYGSNVPFWDQWDSEADFLYRPYLTGDLSFFDLLKPHNEHRILASKLLALFLLEIDGVWFPKLQMVVNACIHVSAIALLLAMLSRGLDRTGHVILGACAALFFSIPFGWENTLAGFQSQFYLVFGFSILAVWLMIPAEAFSPRWLFGYVALIAAYFSMSSGSLAAAAVVSVYFLQFICRSRVFSVREFSGALLIIVAFLVMYKTIPEVAHHRALKANSLSEFLAALLAVASWPGSANPILAILLNLPAALLLARILVLKPAITKPAWLIIGAMAWVSLQWISFAYGRAAEPTASRYLDTITVGLLVNVAAALILSHEVYARRFWGWGFCLVLSAIVLAHAYHPIFQGAPDRKANYDVQAANLSSYIKTGDLKGLASLPFFSIPYPNAERLAKVVDQAEIRDILHPDLTQRPLTDRLLLPKQVTKTFRGMQILLLKSGWIAFVLGVGLLLMSLFLGKKVHPSGEQELY